ncbi:unnamed protein product [Acanthoscelides obtectus]|uniref:Uncharacterized protein n=1 Tax=Acanthoscelides obtectus TaxID=200917 RepID=A0A9P0LLU8_ACAOB|nr:unnamed protein product [Acanthoscelides obtectus]CAK1656554.1 hypothetical protein AOBTE_LOCUS19798 [Acanthoscelides obtectus]
MLCPHKFRLNHSPAAWYRTVQAVVATHCIVRNKNQILSANSFDKNSEVLNVLNCTSVKCFIT